MKKLLASTLAISVLLPFNVYAEEINYQNSEKIVEEVLGETTPSQEEIKQETELVEGNEESKETEVPEQEKELEGDSGGLEEEYEIGEEFLGDNFPNFLTEKSSLMNTMLSDDKYYLPILEMDFGLTEKQAEEYKEFIETTSEEIERKTNSDLEKIILVNDLISDITTYSTNTKHSRHSPYTIVSEGKGVCQAYTVLTYHLLDAMGIENIYTRGTLDGVNHAWNLVNLDGEWFHLDVTGNDDYMGKGTYYNFFLISDDQLSETHVWDKSEYPNAINNKYDYLSKSHRPILYGTNLYFVNLDNNFFIKFNLEKGKEEIILDNVIWDLFEYKNNLYFANYDNYGIFSYDLEKGELKKLTNEFAENLELVGNKILYFDMYGIKKTYVISDSDDTPIDNVNKEKVNKVINLITSINVYSTNFTEQVKSARDNYNSLTEKEKQEVNNYNSLTKHEENIEKLKQELTTMEIWKSTTITDQYKTWTIKFNQEVSEATLTDGVEIKVNGQTLEGIKVSYGEDKKTLKVSAPTKAYGKGLTYNLYIHPTIKSSKGLELKKPIRMDFTMQ